MGRISSMAEMKTSEQLKKEAEEAKKRAEEAKKSYKKAVKAEEDAKKAEKESDKLGRQLAEKFTLKEEARSTESEKIKTKLQDLKMLESSVSEIREKADSETKKACRKILAAIAHVKIELQTKLWLFQQKEKTAKKLSQGDVVYNADTINIMTCKATLNAINILGNIRKEANDLGSIITRATRMFSVAEYEGVVFSVQEECLSDFKRKGKWINGEDPKVYFKNEAEDLVDRVKSGEAMKDPATLDDMKILDKLRDGKITLQEAVEKVNLTNEKVYTGLTNWVKRHFDQKYNVLYNNLRLRVTTPDVNEMDDQMVAALSFIEREREKLDKEKRDRLVKAVKNDPQLKMEGNQPGQEE